MLHLERTPKDKALGYEWIEVHELYIQRGRDDKGNPTAWIGCRVTNDRNPDGDTPYHRSMAWQDIQDAIQSGAYKLTHFANGGLGWKDQLCSATV